MIKTKRQMFVVIASFLLIILLGTTTYAFFNYTRTGTANVIRTGRIAFNSTQGTAMNLTDLFPIDVSEGIPNDNTKVGTLTVNITGDTEYTGGIEYLVTAVNVSNTVGTKKLPISIDVSVANNTENSPATTLGTVNSDYFETAANGGRGGSTSYYKILANNVINNNNQLVVGYIAPGATGVDGNIVIKAYLDKSKILISDTYPERTIRTVKTEGYSSSACETVLTGVNNASTYCATATSLQTAIDHYNIANAKVSLLVAAGIVDEYTNGTPSSMAEGKTVFTTQEWNSLQTNGVSFQIKVEAQEDTWVIQEGTIDSCPGCYFMYTENQYNYGTNASTLADIASNNDTYSTNYKDIVFRNINTITYENNQFLGFTVSNGSIDKAYVCGVLGGMENMTPFCVEGIENGSANTISNENFIESLYSSAYNPDNTYTCNSSNDYPYDTYIRCQDEDNDIYYCSKYNDNYNDDNKYLMCESNFDYDGYGLIVFWKDSGYGEFVDVGDGYLHDCYISNTGKFYCIDETN